MKHLSMLSMTVLCASVLSAQETPPPRAVDQQPQLRVQEQVALSDVLGCDVWLQPTVVRDGTPPRTGEPRPGEPDRTADVRVKDKKGSIDDVIIDGSSGEATWAVVSVGGILGIGDRLVLVPASSLTSMRKSSDAKPEFGLRATEEELKGLPAFDKKAATKAGLREALTSCESAWHKARPGDATLRTGNGTRRDTGNGTKRPADATGKVAGEAGLAPSNMILGTQLQGCPVRTRGLEAGKDFGEVDGASFNLHDHSVDYVIVGQGGVLGIGETDYLVPFEACRIIVTDEDNKPAIALNKTSTEMESAPKYSKPDTGFLSEPNARSSCQFYGIDKKSGDHMDGDKGRLDKGKVDKGNGR